MRRRNGIQGEPTSRAMLYFRQALKLRHDWKS
jgi:hypothetical protein